MNLISDKARKYLIEKYGPGDYCQDIPDDDLREILREAKPKDQTELIQRMNEQAAFRKKLIDEVNEMIEELRKGERDVL